MYYPGSTYRIQFHKSFTFRDFKRIIPYLDKLGIQTIYASPIFDAMPGSVHGYDGTDPNKINPEIGTYEELKEIAALLKERNMGWIQDFVPNHMAYSINNPWLADLLEKGKLSLYDGYFDADLTAPLMAPFLDASLNDAIEQGQITLAYKAGQLRVRFNETELPLNVPSYTYIFNHGIWNDINDLKKEFRKVAVLSDKPSFYKEWHKRCKKLSRQLSEEQVQDKLQQLSEDKAFVKAVLDLQYYRLCNWRETNEAINYRRFFTVNGLICMNIQRQDVFDHYHQLLAQLVKDDIFQGVRIDHIDGLYDPAKYLNDLRSLLGDDTYIVVEKILGHDETLPANWPVQGSTGYDFLAQVNKVLTNQEGTKELIAYYDTAAGHSSNAQALIEQYKDRFLRSYMQGEWNNLLHQLQTIAGNAIPETIPEDDLKELIAGLLVSCPVYRFYIDAVPFDDANKQKIDALMAAVASNGKVPTATLQFFREYFIDNIPTHKDKRAAILYFWHRCMQFSGPLMAKGIEDTLAYNYNAFLANNEVGNEIHSTGMNIQAFQELMQQRATSFPLSMNATATHDTKRGEDSRSRLQYLSAYAGTWLKEMGSYLQDDGKGPGIEERYFMLQILYSSFGSGEAIDAYKTRLKDFLIKAAREAGRFSGWHKPDEAYEKRFIDFGLSIINSEAGKRISDFLNAHKEQMAQVALNQLILKCTCPGIPDIYQGTEFWDFSFVDPDNRRPVDYDARIEALQKITDAGFDAAAQDIAAPVFKMFVLHKLLQLRKKYLALFEEGTYRPLELPGPYLSFTREQGKEHLLVILLLNPASQAQTSLRLPDGISGKYRNIFTDQIVAVEQLNIQKELQQFPLLVLIAQPQENERKSGVLLPLFSLPSAFGIGGLGKEAYDFIAILAKAKQTLWQLLPLNPVQKAGHYSPYACVSAFAGEPMYIDPVWLEKEGLVSSKEVSAIKRAPSATIAYARVRKAKAKILDKAWAAFKEGDHPALRKEFEQFCEAEKGWLPDYAFFVVITEQFQHKPWFQWPEPLRKRDAKALAAIRAAQADALDFEQWKQFIFFRQWNEVREAARRHGIKLIGDIPFYLSHNSTDVWANQSLFSLDKNGEMTSSAGVPPDYFSETGQLWLMPTYNWKAVQENNYGWWLARLQQNVKLFDIVRLDHFRAFYDYWEVPAKNENAINGEWKDGPKEQLFDLIQQRFPDMPFIAEDLGEIHPGVFAFKDQYKLKGMRILQFGFDPFNEQLRDLPSNFDSNTVVYTGTHDNDTTAGWYCALKKASRKALSEYTGQKVTDGNVHDMLIRMAHQSVAAWSVIPAQDIIGLDESARLNTPGTVKHNWLWQLLPHQITSKQMEKLKDWTRLYNR